MIIFGGFYTFICGGGEDNSKGSRGGGENTRAQGPFGGLFFSFFPFVPSGNFSREFDFKNIFHHGGGTGGGPLKFPFGIFFSFFFSFFFPHPFTRCLFFVWKGERNFWPPKKQKNLKGGPPRGPPGGGGMDGGEFFSKKKRGKGKKKKKGKKKEKGGGDCFLWGPRVSLGT